MLTDLSKTIKAQLYDRASSPLLVSFGLSWTGWNYKFVLVILSSMPLPEKLAFIESIVFPTPASIWLNGLAYPLFTALALIFVYPIPASYVYEYTRKRQRDLKAIQLRIDDESPLTRQEARDIRSEALRATIDLEGQLERRNGDVQRLKELVASLESQISRPQEPPRIMGSAPDKTPQNATISQSNPDTKHRSEAIPPDKVRHQGSRVLLPPEQFIFEALKNFLTAETTFGDQQFTLDVKADSVILTFLPNGLLGQTKTFRYPYELNQTGTNIDREIARIKLRILKDRVKFQGRSATDNFVKPSSPPPAPPPEASAH